MAVHNIEVAVTTGVTSTERGKLLEDLMRELFDATGHTSGPTIRVTGMEIDLTAIHNVTNENIYAECKAHRDSVPAESLAKILGNVIMRNADQGWLVTTSNLSKDAEGWKTDWETRAPEERRRLQIYDPPRLLDLLISSKRIIDPGEVAQDVGPQQSVWYLLLTNLGRFWARLVPEGGVYTRVIAYHAQSGRIVDDDALLHNLKSTDTSLVDLDWVSAIPNDTVPVESTAPEIVVEVTEGDNWTDYRPARPQDFVGRQDIQDIILGFFESIRAQNVATRLFSIRAPSGWGKSSLIAKLRNRCGNVAHRRKFHMFAVDMRAAQSASYVSAALVRCFRSAVEDRFIRPPVMPLQAGPPNAPLDSESLSDCLQQLRASDRVLVLVFDQFEEVLTKPDLRSLFDRLRLLALAVDAYQANFVLGFAWKTDAFLPQDHPAYYLWHQLADRRLDVEVPRFGGRDVSQALARFQSELKQRLNPVLRLQLTQHCQGFPWLLKKLCIHVYNLVRNGLSQPQVLDRGLDVSSLFDADLSELSGTENLCLKEIARLAPADWLYIADQFGNDTLTSLTDRRLIIRSGDRLNPYWDIFGDYLRTGTAPLVPVAFLPGAEVRTLMRATLAAASVLRAGNKLTSGAIGELLGLNEKSAMNVVRDLGFFGLVERRDDNLVTAFGMETAENTLIEVTQIVATVLRNHAFTNVLRRDLPKDSTITEAELLRFFGEAFPYANLRGDTRRTYTLRLAKYLVAIQFLERYGNSWRLLDNPPPSTLRIMPRTRGSGEFTGDAPPEKVLQVLKRLSMSPTPRSQLSEIGWRNAVSCAISLNLVTVVQGTLALPTPVALNPLSTMRSALEGSSSFKAIRQAMGSVSGLSATELGKILSDEFNLPWSEASCLRRGGALRRWVKWYEGSGSGDSKS